MTKHLSLARCRGFSVSLAICRLAGLRCTMHDASLPHTNVRRREDPEVPSFGEGFIMNKRSRHAARSFLADICCEVGKSCTDRKYSL